MAETIKASRKKLAIIDGKSVFYRGYYAMPNLSTKDGIPTGGVFGFAVMALEVIRRLKPDYICVAWDKPKTNIRKRTAIYPAYKANRKPAPPDFYAQIPLLQELLRAFGWPLYELDDYEADDIMGALAVQATARDIETMLVTSDLDMLQIVDPHVHVFALKKGLSNIELYSPKTFEAKYGIRVDQFLDYKSLIGDSSDNIPGVPGIGPVAARKLLDQYETLDGIYENIELISGTLRQKLKDSRDLAYMSKKLARIWTDAPVKLDLAEVDGSKCDPIQVQGVLQKFEFRTLARQLPEIMQVPETAVVEGSKEQIGSKPGKNLIIDTDKSLDGLKLGKAESLVVYSQSTGAHGKDPKAILISPAPEKIYSLIMDKLSVERIQKKLDPLLSDEKIKKIGYDIKTHVKAAYEIGCGFGGVGHDVLIGAFLLNSLRREQTLTELARVELGYEGPEFENLSAEEVVERAPQIVGTIRDLYAQQSEDFQGMPKIADLAEDIEWPVIPVLAAMEHKGILLDSDYLHRFSEELKDLISDLEQQIYGHADQEFNIGSPRQLSEILFGKLNLPTQGVKRGKSGDYSTAANELDRLLPLHPIIQLLIQYREVTKLMSTYVETLPKLVDENGRLHTTYDITIAQTGRLSSRDPNLQNIPVRTELGNRIRTAFVADPGKVLVSADYSQFELRLAAVLADDKDLIDMFNRDVDVHAATAAQVYGREPEDITKNMRRDAKVINFGVLYGMSPHGLSMATGMTFEAAKQFIDKYFELRKPMLEYMNKLRETARSQGYVETMFGRRRPMPDIHSSNFVVRAAAERAAINMPIQGSEADLMKLAMIKVQDYLDKRSDSHMLLQIHDSILIETPEAEAEELTREVKEIMENIHKLPVKLTVDTSVGKNWGDL